MAEPPVQQKALLLIKGGHLFAPKDKGKCDILIGGSKILATWPSQSTAAHDTLVGLPLVTIIDANGQFVVPGFVDMHVHVTGGGGEIGPESRCPEAKLSELIDSGVTTVIGILGTDGTSRSLPNLLAKTRALHRQGLSAYMYTGAYEYPPPTLTGGVRTDIMHIEQCVGVGEVAVSDSRSSAPTTQELARLALEARVAGMLSGKAGVVHVHVGKGPSGLEPLRDVVRDHPEVPRTVFHPTHLSSRGPDVLLEAMDWCREGGTIDFTADDENESGTEHALLQVGAESDAATLLDRVTISSDAYGSFPVLDAQGRVASYGVGKPTSLLHTLQKMTKKHGWSLEKILPLFTSNAARILQLDGKGVVAEGAQADLLLLNAEMQICSVIAKGVILKTGTYTKRGMFEE